MHESGDYNYILCIWNVTFWLRGFYTFAGAQNWTQVILELNINSYKGDKFHASSQY